MSGYLLLHWRAGDEAAERIVDEVERSLAGDPAKMVRIRQRGLLIDGQGDPVRSAGPGVHILGDLFAGAGPVTFAPYLHGISHATFRAGCGELLARNWGSYVAVRYAPDDPAPLAIFAEPIGVRETVSWQHQGLRFVSAAPEPWLSRFPPAGLAIDLDELAHIVARPSAATESRPLAGVMPIAPGALTLFGPDGPTIERLWTPRSFCGGRTDADPAALMRLVDSCIAAWRASGDGTLLELSGGLDSAIVAAALAATGQRAAHAVTFFGDELAGDERRYARATAERLDLTGEEIPLLPRPIDEALLAGIASGLRPGIGSTTFFHDAILAERGLALGAGQLFTGRGGDALFFQHPSPTVAADPWSGGRPGRLRALEPLARWTRQPIWVIAARAWLPDFAIGRPVTARQSRFARTATAPRPSSWAGSLAGLSSAKRMQLLALAGDRAAFGPSRCAEAMRVIHPLLSQPLVEHCLGLSVTALTEGRRDRGLARSAFAGRLPEMMVERRGKGALSGFFGRTLAMSTGLLRDQLLGGVLAEAGLLDRPALEAALTQDHLIQIDCYTELLSLLLIETWARRWRERLAQR